jgi:hypothetical protein
MEESKEVPFPCRVLKLMQTNSQTDAQPLYTAHQIPWGIVSNPTRTH